jgi:hypothetical protein
MACTTGCSVALVRHSRGHVDRRHGVLCGVALRGAAGQLFVTFSSWLPVSVNVIAGAAGVHIDRRHGVVPRLTGKCSLRGKQESMLSRSSSWRTGYVFGCHIVVTIVVMACTVRVARFCAAPSKSAIYDRPHKRAPAAVHVIASAGPYVVHDRGVHRR